MKERLKEGPMLKTVKAASLRHRPYCSKIKIRGFTFIIDEPEKLGGKNRAPTPMEYILGALNGCFAVTIELLLEEYRHKLESLELSSEGTIDHRGLFGNRNVSPHFQSVKIEIIIHTTKNLASRRQFEQYTLERCPVYNLIKDSGAKTQVVWSWNHG